MKQLGYKPYLDFVRRTAEYFDETTVFGDKLVKFVGKHRGFDSLPTNEADRVTFFDELNAIIYGHYASGKMDGLDGPLHQAFRDFDRYIEELDNIHKQFKNRSDKPISPSGENGKAKPACGEPAAANRRPFSRSAAASFQARRSFACLSCRSFLS